MFQVFYSPGAGKALRKMSKEEARRIIESIDVLSEANNPKNYIKKLKGSFRVPLYSFRIGDHRVILSIREELFVIYVIEIGNRSKVYRNY